MKSVSRPLSAPRVVCASCHLPLLLLKAMLVWGASGLGTMGSSCADGEQEKQRHSDKHSNKEKMRDDSITSCGYYKWNVEGASILWIDAPSAIKG